MNLTRNMHWTLIAIAGAYVLGDVAVSLKTAGITAQSIDAFIMDLGRGEVAAALGATFTGAGGFFVGKLRGKQA